LIASLAFSASMALPACRSSQKPIVALATSSSRMMKKLGQWRTTPKRITAASIIQGIGPQKYDRNFRIALVFFSGILFGPYFSSRFSTSSSGSDLRSSFASEGNAGLPPGDFV